jgi:16S rRNA (uracil1498-N3)-methyltransferase
MTIRLYWPEPIAQHDVISLSMPQTHYLHNVMRTRVEDVINIFNENSGEWRAGVVAISRNRCEIIIVEQLRQVFKANRLFLAYAPVKQGCAIASATEMGVTDIIPVITARTIVRTIKIDRLKQIVIESAEQCGRIDPPTVHQSIDLTSLINQQPFSGKLLYSNPYLYPQVTKELSIDGDSHCILVGPEGGFNEDEHRMILGHHNTISIGMGQRILKANTAVVAAIATYQALHGYWNHSC